jgi:hypothetical protein
MDEMRSVEEVRAYKPDPRVYRLMDALAPAAATLFVSSNAFDAEGAKRNGRTVCFIDRGGATPGLDPDLRVRSLAESGLEHRLPRPRLQSALANAGNIAVTATGLRVTFAARSPRTGPPRLFHAELGIRAAHRRIRSCGAWRAHYSNGQLYQGLS